MTGYISNHLRAMLTQFRLVRRIIRLNTNPNTLTILGEGDRG